MSSTGPEEGARFYKPAEDTWLLMDCLLSDRRNRVTRAVDVGCGTGAVTEALLQLSDEVLAVDVDVGALIELRSRLKGSLERIETVAADKLSFLRPGCRIELIASNPPYLPYSGDEPFDPTIHSGPEGTEFARDLIASALRLLGCGWEAYVIASSLSRLDDLIDWVCSLGLRVTVLARRRRFFEDILCLRVTCDRSGSVHER
ncbi:MAG: methyltransferase [Aigarchaeota archaeon]|nr:methyltransferase [Candidatus Calditenuis fumarioli]